MVRFVLPSLVCCVMAGAVFLGYEHFSSERLTVVRDPVLALGTIDSLIALYVVFGLIATALLTALTYLLQSLRKAAGRMAYTLSRDISVVTEQFRKLYQLSPVPYLLINEQGVIERPNKASLRFFGVSEEELRGQNFFNYLSTDPDKVALYRERLRRHVAVEQTEAQVTRGEGEVRWVLLSIEDMSGSGHGAKHQGLVTLVDIHEQKEVERVKTEFLSLASHQLRAPLANVKWYIDFLLTRRAEQMSDDIRGYVEKIYRRNQNMIELVNTLLNLSRMEMGRLQVETADTDITDIIMSVVEELEPAAREKSLKIESELGERMIIETDKRLVRVIVQNLISNAIRYTPDGGGVQVQLSTGPRGTVLLSVTDSGIGIPPEEQSHIFSKLYRASNAREMEVNGNGIGLYMCKSLAEAMGGTIDFTSTVGKGATFRLQLPV